MIGSKDVCTFEQQCHHIFVMSASASTIERKRKRATTSQLSE